MTYNQPWPTVKCARFPLVERSTSACLPSKTSLQEQNYDMIMESVTFLGVKQVNQAIINKCSLQQGERMNRPRSIYQYSNKGPRLSGLTSIFGVVFFVSKSPVGIERQKKLEKFAILTRKPRSHA